MILTLGHISSFRLCSLFLLLFFISDRLRSGSPGTDSEAEIDVQEVVSCFQGVAVALLTTKPERK